MTTGIRPVLKSRLVWLLVAASAAGFAALVVTDHSAGGHASGSAPHAPPRHTPPPRPEWRGQIAVAVPKAGRDPTVVDVARPEASDPAVIYRAPASQAIRDLAWSPDGARLAVVVGRPGGSGHVLVMQSTGDDVTAVTHGRRVTSASVAWSPDGHRLAYDMGRSAHLERGTPLVVSRADGSHQKVVSPPHEHVIAPAWSPDGSRIAYISAHAPGDFAGRSGDVEVVPVTGGAPRKLAVEYSGHDPVWSPGGREVVFATSWQGGQGFAEVGTRPRSTVFLTFDCSRRLRCDTIGRPTFAPGDGAIGFIAVVDHPPRSVVAVARHGAMTESAPLLRFPLYRCCLSWWTPGPGQRSV